MSNAKNNERTRTLRQGRVPLLSDCECAEIAAGFDGTTECIDALLADWSRRRPGVKRHTIIQAAKRGGYKTTKQRKHWSAEEDKFIRDNWHRISGDSIAAELGRTFTSVNLRRKRIGIGRYEGDELTIRDIEELTRIDHRQWHELVERGCAKPVSGRTCDRTDAPRRALDRPCPRA